MIVPSHTHSQQPYVLPNGATLYLSAALSPPGPRIPTLAVYLDPMWEPDCLAYHIGWPDFKAPLPNHQVVLRIAHQTVYEAAAPAALVEVGCMGGHGRTGTFAAICALVCDRYRTGRPRLTPKGAVQHVRAGFCPQAVESAAQLAYLHDIYDILAAGRPRTGPEFSRPSSEDGLQPSDPFQAGTGLDLD